MLFLFENTLIHYIYIVFYTLISLAHPSHNLGNLYAISRHATPTATPSPRSEQLHNMGNQNRTTSGRTPTATPSPTSRALSTPMRNHTKNDTQGAHLPQHHHPARRGHIPVKSGLTSSIPMDCSAAVALSWLRFAQNHNLL